MSYDVVVVGLGGMGSAAACQLARRGAKVLGLDLHAPAHDRGSSHGGSRIIRQSSFEDPAYVPLLLRAYELWEQLAQDSGQDVITLTGGLMVSPPDSSLVAGSLRAARQWGLRHEVLDPPEVRRRFPTFCPADDELALFEATAGLVRPETAVTAHLALAARAGAELHFREPVLSWDTSNTGVRVRTAAGSYDAGELVIAPGAWAPRLLNAVGAAMEVERQVMYWFEPAGGVGPYLPGRHPVHLHEDHAGRQSYGFPAIDGPHGGVKVAFIRPGQRCDPDTIDRAVSPREVHDVRHQVSRLVPSLPGQFLKSATCMYSNAPDRHFVIAKHPDHARVTVAYGFSGHGFKFVPVVGEILADLAITGATDHPITLFDPRRPALAGPTPSVT